MADKRFYYIKMPEDFFNQKEIKKLRKIAGGDTYTIIYQKMLLSSLKTNGVLFFEGLEDSFAEELALEIDEDPENVKIVVAYLLKNGLMFQDGAEYSLEKIGVMTGSESASAERMRRMREGQRNNVTHQLRNGDVDIEIDIENRDRDREDEENTVCDEQTPQTAESPASPTVISLPYGSGKALNITEDDVKHLESLYPSLDILQELRNIAAWLDGNVERRNKTLSGLRKRITGWLMRSQKDAKGRDSQPEPCGRKVIWF